MDIQVRQKAFVAFCQSINELAGVVLKETNANLNEPEAWTDEMLLGILSDLFLALETSVVSCGRKCGFSAEQLKQAFIQGALEHELQVKLKLVAEKLKEHQAHKEAEQVIQKAKES